jgi:hypothetical protein
MRFLAPPPLRPGDRVAVVAPAGPFDRPSFEKGLEVLKTRYQPVFTERLFDTHRYLAGTDAVRGADLQAALDHTEVKAVFAARGGYGAMRLLPSLSLSSPKWLVGFSDLTALHCAAQVKGWQSLHAPVLTQLGKQPPEVIAVDRTIAVEVRGACFARPGGGEADGGVVAHRSLGECPGKQQVRRGSRGQHGRERERLVRDRRRWRHGRRLVRGRLRGDRRLLAGDRDASRERQHAGTRRLEGLSGGRACHGDRDRHRQRERE